jgi:hypothetical protein
MTPEAVRDDASVQCAATLPNAITAAARRIERNGGINVCFLRWSLTTH